MNAVVVHLREELAISLGAAEQADDEDPRAIDGKQRPDTVELGSEDLEHDEGKGELGERRPNIGTFKGSLRCAHLDDFVRGQHR